MNSYRILNDADTPSPLPQRVVPNPDEDLLSVLRRSASRMGYPDLRWLLRPEGNKWSIEDTEIPLLSAKKDYDVLEHLLILSEEKLYSHTLHRFASLLEGVYGGQQPAEPVNPFTNLMRLSTVSQSTYFLPILSIRVCPICLQEQKCYDRLYWRLQLIFHSSAFLHLSQFSVSHRSFPCTVFRLHTIPMVLASDKEMAIHCP